MVAAWRGNPCATVSKGYRKSSRTVSTATCNALQSLQVPLRDALLAWCRWRVRPVAAGRLTGRAWPAARVTWAWSSAAATFATTRTRTALAGAAATASATLCHDDLRRQVIPAPAKATPSAHLLAHNCVPISAFRAAAPRGCRVPGRSGAHFVQVQCALSCWRWPMTYSQMLPTSRAACSMMRAASGRLPMLSAFAATRSNTRRR